MFCLGQELRYLRIFMYFCYVSVDVLAENKKLLPQIILLLVIWDINV